MQGGSQHPCPPRPSPPPSLSPADGTAVYHPNRPGSRQPPPAPLPRPLQGRGRWAHGGRCAADERAGRGRAIGSGSLGCDGGPQGAGGGARPYLLRLPCGRVRRYPGRPGPGTCASGSTACGAFRAHGCVSARRISTVLGGDTSESRGRPCGRQPAAPVTSPSRRLLARTRTHALAVVLSLDGSHGRPGRRGRPGGSGGPDHDARWISLPLRPRAFRLALTRDSAH